MAGFLNLIIQVLLLFLTNISILLRKMRNQVGYYNVDWSKNGSWFSIGQKKFRQSPASSPIGWEDLQMLCQANSRESPIQRQFFSVRNPTQAIYIRQQKSPSISWDRLFNMTGNIRKDRRQRRGWQRCANFKKNFLTQGKFILWTMVEINF